MNKRYGAHCATLLFQNKKFLMVHLLSLGIFYGIHSVHSKRNFSLHGAYPDGQKILKIYRLSLYPVVFQNILASYLSNLISKIYDTTTWYPCVTKSRMSACHNIYFAANLAVYETFYCHILSSPMLS